MNKIEYVHFVYTGIGDIPAWLKPAIFTASVRYNTKPILWISGARAIEDPTYDPIRSFTDIRVIPDHMKKISDKIKDQGGTTADYIRMEVLYEYGGLYLDADTLSHKPIYDLIEGREFVIGRYMGDTYGSAIVYTRRKHNECIQNIRLLILQRLIETNFEPVWGYIGPQAVKEVIDRMVSDEINHGIYISPINYFYKYNHTNSSDWFTPYKEGDIDDIYFAHISTAMPPAFFNNISDQYIQDNDCLYSRIVKGAIADYELETINEVSNEEIIKVESTISNITTVNGKKNIGLYFSHCPKKLYGGIWGKEPLGGTETSSLLLAHEIKDKYNVHIFANTDENEYEGVKYIPYEKVSLYNNIIDTMIVTGAGGQEKAIASDLLNGIPNIMMWLWSCGGEGITKDQFEIIKNRCNNIICVSYWHFNKYCNEMKRVNGVDFHEIDNKFQVIHGFIPSVYATKSPRSSREDTIIYASVPNRGLIVYNKILPKLRRICPNLKLHVYSSFKTYGINDDEGVLNLYKELSSNTNCEIKQPVSFIELCDIYSKALLVGYPSLFEETMCVVASLAMRTGTPIVSSNHSAISETTSNSPYLIDVVYNNEGELQKYVNSENYINDYVNKVAELYYDKGLWEDEHNRCIDESIEQGIEYCADAFISLIEGL